MRKLFHRHLRECAIIFIALVCLAPTAHADCGNIIRTVDYGDGPEMEVTPIEDCDNPFNADTPAPFDYTLTLAGQVVREGVVVTVTEGEAITGSSSISKANNFSVPPLQLFRQEENDFQQIQIENSRSISLETLPAGEYVAVFTYEQPPMPVEALPLFKQRIQSWFMSTTAHAFFPDYIEVVAVPFTVIYHVTPPPPTGASSVLFLPGIQASLLYKKGLAGSEDQIWPPNSLFNNDVKALRLSTEGVSENDIYTEGAISSNLGVGDVYAGFQRYLTELQSQEVIENWTPFAYDWRYSVTDLAENGTLYKEGVRRAIDEIEYLAASSYSGKVTIIGHSNGGLLAKAIMNELEEQNKTNLIDTVVFLASPQLGTPKAIGTILHGYDQTDKLGGIIIHGQTAREVINNMPGAYGLLPSEQYFDGLNEPVVTFTNNATTEPYRLVYGDTLDTYEQYVSFIRGEDTLERDLSKEKSIPARANGNMLDQALAMHKHELDNWVAPPGVKVIEIVGTGLPTMKSVEYREIIEQKCASAGPAGQVCVDESEMKPYAVLTKYGDGTVVQRSAEAYRGEKERYFLNLVEVKKSIPNSKFTHHNITETFHVQDFFTELLLGTTTVNSRFISDIQTEFSDEYDVELIDSPVRLLATDADGNETGIVIIDGVRVIKEEIPGSQYFEFGDTKYFVVPKGTERTTKLYGEDYGGYTLTTAVLDDEDTQVLQTQLKNASTTPNLVAEYSNIDGVYSSIVTDLDGDGVIDFETTMDGVSLVQEEVSYDTLLQAIKDTELVRLRESVLIIMVQKAEYYSHKAATKKAYAKLEDVFLQSASELVKHYVRKKYLTAADGTNLQDMIKILKTKQ